MTRTISFTSTASRSRPRSSRITIWSSCCNANSICSARESCGQGMCGCCTVLVNGTAVSGCLYLAAFVDGAEVTTVESLANGDTLSPVQEAFIEAKPSIAATVRRAS